MGGFNNDTRGYAERWWQFAKTRPELRRALISLRRFISTTETAKHRIFAFVDAEVLPDQKLREIVSDDAFILGTLSSRIVSILRQIHDDLDAAVFDAYGWPASLTDEEILERLVALNRERAEEEKRGLIRWLRPEFQNPAGARPETQATLAEAGLETPAGKPLPGKAAKTPWPKRLAERVALVRDLLGETDGATETTAVDLAKRLRGANADAVEAVLESLAAVGRAQEIPTAAGGRGWRALR